jgi:hypothetical protein
MTVFRRLHDEHYQSQNTHALFERRETVMPGDPKWERLSDDEKLITPIENRPVERAIAFEPMFLHCSICESLKRSQQ